MSTGTSSRAAIAAVIVRRNLAWVSVLTAAVVVVWTTASPLVARTASVEINIGAGGWSAAWVLQWVAFAAGVAVSAWLPVLVAHGISRRAAATAGIGAAVAYAAGLAVVMQLQLLAASAAHRAAGVPSALSGDQLFSHLGQVHLVIGGYAIGFTAFAAAGLLTGTAYYRFRAVRGTLLLPLCLSPAAATFLALSAGWQQAGADDPPWVATIHTPAAFALAAAAAAAGLAAVRLTTRSLPLNPA
jgi:hypothetical protein